VSNKYNLGGAGRWGVCVLTLTVATLLDFSSAFAQSSSISEYEIPTVSSRPTSITSGPDGNLWFVETYSTNISKITPSGVITEFSLIYFAAQSIVSGPDGNLWFTTYGCVFCSPSASAGIGEIAPSGNSGATYNFSVRVAHPYSITSGPDGNLWFTESNNIGRITPAGVISEFPIPSGNTATGITSGPDGNLWFTEQDSNNIGQISTTGVYLNEFPVTTGSGPAGITGGLDGNLWFAESTGDKIGRITPGLPNTVTEFPIPAGSSPFNITSSPSGSLWFTEEGSNKIGQMSTAGMLLNEFPIPTNASVPVGIAMGPDGNLWFTENVGNNIGKLDDVFRNGFGG
jgi:streptogramin lyase